MLYSDTVSLKSPKTIVTRENGSSAESGDSKITREETILRKQGPLQVRFTNNSVSEFVSRYRLLHVHQDIKLQF